MPNLPVRKLGDVGVMTDANPFDLPLNAFTEAANVIFDDGRIQRSPMFKQLFAAIRSTLSYDASTGAADDNTAVYDSAEGSASNNARFVGSYTDFTAGETVFVCDRDGTVRSYPNKNLTFTTPGAGTVTNDEVWSHAQVAGLSFLTRKGMRPYVRNLRTDTTYSLLANDWPSTDTAAIVRSYLDFAILLNVSKSGVDYPTMVKWCNPLQYSQSVTSIAWDPANTSYVAGENLLSELKTGIRDGLVLGNQFVIYAQDQVWLMEYTGSSFVFNFRRLFATGGVINTNCVVEVEGKHFVFGEDDIYVHDGSTKQSIADGRIRRRVFQTLDRAKQSSCFVVHDSVSNLIHFCFPSKRTEVGFPNTQYCNRSATYNYRNNTWTFLDLPNIVGGAEASVSIASTSYPSVTASYGEYNVAFTAFESGTPRIPIMLGIADTANGITESRVYAVDLPTVGLVNLPVHPETVKPAMVERIGIDLDDQGLQLPVRSYKNINSISPQVVFDNSQESLTFSFGSSDYPNTPPKYRYTTTFNPTTQYKVDMNVGGRYLAYKMTTNSFENFRFSGFDAEIQSFSRR